MKFLCEKKSKSKMAAGPVKKLKAGDPAPPTILIMDNEDGTATVFGIDQAGAKVDIKDVATLTDSSDNTAILTVGAITGMTFAYSGVAPGTANILLTATWNDSSVGPFPETVPATVTNSPVKGIVVELNAPTPRP